jgi:hypothetical protein
VVKSQAAKRGFSADKVGAIGISAGAKAVLLLATSSQTRAYEMVDEIDKLSAKLLFAIPQAPAYVLEAGSLVKEGPALELLNDDAVKNAYLGD